MLPLFAVPRFEVQRIEGTAVRHRKRIVALAYPVYFELLAGVAAGIINMVWVAHLGGAAVAAVAVATNVENVLLGVILMAGSGTTVLVARARGAEDPGAVRAAVRGGWALCALLVPPVAIGGYVLREPLARLVIGGGTPAALAAGYFAISLPGMAVHFGTNLLDGVLKGAGDTRTPMRLAFLANGLILVLDPVLIDRYGIRGAALATVIGRSAALAAGLVALRRNPVLRAAGKAPASRPLLAALRLTARTGLPMSADFVVRMAGALAMVAVVARLGVTAVAAYGIATKAMYVATMAFYAVRQAAAIHTAQLLGAGQDERRAVGRQALLVSGAVGTAAAVLLLGTASWIMRAFGGDPEVADAGALFLRCLGPYLVLLACFIALGGVFEGSGGSPLVARITAAGSVVQLPLAYGLSGLGLPGICLAMALAMGVQYAALARLFGRTAPGRRRGQDPRSALSGSG
ncbi:MATE family efflux transporter [Streptomyces sp. NPDC002133]|uniref:MATE family efflux transporter n=1 Tax=Streptomyces sp. NPDC002133 TaxID=3154409 RepID=UPI003320B62A